MSISESKLEAQSLLRLNQIVRIPEGLEYPTEIKKLMKAQNKAVELWGKAQVAISDARAALENQKAADDAAMRAAAREGSPDPRKPEDMEMLTRVVEYATIQEEEARQLANTSGVRLREAIQNNRDAVLALVTKIYVDSFGKYSETIENIEKLYRKAKEQYREDSNTVNILLQITEGYNPRLGGEERGLELPRYEATGIKAIKILQSLASPITLVEPKSSKARTIEEPVHVVHIGHTG